MALCPARAAEPRVERLDSGLRIIIIEDGSLPLVSVSLWYGVGSTADPPTQAGLTHIARAALERRDALDLRAKLAGVRFDSRTYRDACVFQSIAAKSLLEYVLDLEAARLRPLVLDTDQAATDARDYALLQHNVQTPLSHEFWLRRSVGRLDPLSAATRDSIPLQAPAAQTLLAAVFGDHPYSRPPSFVTAKLAALDVATLNEHLSRWFVPGNATLIVHGDVESISTLEAVRQRFGTIAWSDVPRLASAERPPMERVEIAARSDECGVAIAWWLPAWVLPENVGVHALLHRLCNPVDGPLAARLAAAGCGTPRWEMLNAREAGAAILFVSLPANGDLSARAAAIERIVLEELTAITNAPADVVALQRAKSLALTDLRETRAALRSRTALFGAYDQIAGDLFLAQFDLRRIERLTPAAFRAASKYLLETRMVVMRVGAQEPYCDTPYAWSDTRNVAAARANDPQRRAAIANEVIEKIRHNQPDPIAGLSVEGSAAAERVETVDLSGLPTATVITLLPESILPRIVLETRLMQQSGRYSQPMLRDLLSFRGWTLRIARTDFGVGLASTGPSDEWTHLIELHAEILATTADVAVAPGAARNMFDRRAQESDAEYADRISPWLMQEINPRNELDDDANPPPLQNTRWIVVGKGAQAAAAYLRQMPSTPTRAHQVTNSDPGFIRSNRIPIYWASGTNRGQMRMLLKVSRSEVGAWEYLLAQAANNSDSAGDWHVPGFGDNAEGHLRSANGVIALTFPTPSENCAWSDSSVTNGLMSLYFGALDVQPPNGLTMTAAPLRSVAGWDSSTAIANEMSFREDVTSGQLVPYRPRELDRYDCDNRFVFLIVGDSDNLANDAHEGRVIPIRK